MLKNKIYLVSSARNTAINEYFNYDACYVTYVKECLIYYYLGRHQKD